MADEMMLGFEEGPAPQEEEAGPSLSEAEAKRLKQRLKVSEKFKEKVFKPHYDTSSRLERGIHWPEGKSGSSEESRVIVNMVYPIVATKVATVGFRHPEFNLTPVTMQSAGRAQLATAAMRYEWKIAKVQREAVRALHDKEVFKFGVCMTGWEYKTHGGVNRKDGRPDEDEAAIDFEAMAREVSETGSPAAEEVDPDPICDQFYCRRISPWNFLIDPEGDWVLDNHEFCGYVEFVPVQQLKGDKRLKNTQDLKGNSKGLMSFLDDDLQKREEQDHPTDIKRVKVFHYFEKGRQLYAMFCEEHDKPLLVQKWSWEHGRYPFRVIHAMGDEDCWYGTTPVELVQSQQEELNVTRTMLRNHIRRFTRKYSVSRGMLDRVAKQQLKSAIDGAIVEHNGGPDARIINPIDHAPIPAEIYKTDEWVIRDMRFMTGLDEYDTNTVGKTRRTAAEVSQIRQAGGNRAQQDAQLFEQFCAEIGEDLLDLLMQYSQKARSIPVYGPNENITEWSNFTADDIEGEYLVDVYIGSTQPKNSFEMQQTYAWLLQTLGPMAQMPDPMTGQPMVNMKALVKGLLSNFPEIKNMDEILNTAPPPMQPGMVPGMPMGQPPPVGPDGLPLPQMPPAFMGAPE